MPLRRGPTLEIDDADEAGLDWITELLAQPQIHLPLSLDRAPTRDEVAAGQLELIEFDGDLGRDTREHTGTRFLIIRDRESSRRLGFWLHFGWDHTHDTTRELDTAVEGAAYDSFARFFESHVLLASELFSGRAKRLRWRTRQKRSRPLRWYERLGARALGKIEEPHPTTGERIHRHVYEVSKAEYLAVLDAVGLQLEQDYLGVDLWQRFRDR